MIRMGRNMRSRIFRVILGLMPVFFLQSCFTGVESTGKITLSKKDMAVIIPSQEELFLADIQPQTVKDWKLGKQFVVTDDKLRYVLEGASSKPLTKGDTIVFDRVESRYSAGGGESSLLVFKRNGSTFVYPLEKNIENAEKDFTSSHLPMMIDLDIVETVKQKLEGKKLWTRSSLWYDDSLKYQKGGKYIDVTVDDVSCGDSFFPLLVKFTDSANKTGYYLMNIGNTGNESRSFSRLFYLSDPRNVYRQISDENWLAIQKEELRIGMTKEECRLSKGTPSDMDAGHSYSSTMEIWKYSDGTILRFVDGQLISYQ